MVLADCVRDTNAAMDALMAYDDRALDLNSAETRKDIGTKASVGGSTLGRCDGIANESVHKSPNSAVWWMAPKPVWGLSQGG